MLSVFVSVLILLLTYVIPEKFIVWIIRFMAAHGICKKYLIKLTDLHILDLGVSTIVNLMTIFLIVLIVLFLKKQNRKNPLGESVFHNSITVGFWKRILLLFTAFIMGLCATQVTVLAISCLSGELQDMYSADMSSIVSGNTPIYWIALFISYVILASITEELLFRGIIYTYIRKHYSAFFTILFSSVLFAAIHGNIIQIVYALLIGVLLGAIREWNGSVIYTIAFHIGFNLMGSGILAYPQADWFCYMSCSIFIICFFGQISFCTINPKVLR